MRLVLVLFLLAFKPVLIESSASVRPAVLEAKTFPAFLFNSDCSGIRNFSANSESPSHPSFPVLPVKQAQTGQDEDRCILKENFRIYADRGQDPAQIGLTCIYIGYPSNSKSINYCFPFVLISSKTGSSFKTRPPPVI